MAWLGEGASPSLSMSGCGISTAGIRGQDETRPISGKSAGLPSSGGASQVALGIKNPPANAGGTRDVGSVPGLGRSPGGGHGNPLRYSCLENPMDTGAWWATVHRAEKSRTQMKRFSMHSMYKFCQEKCLLTAPGPLLKEIN